MKVIQGALLSTKPEVLNNFHPTLNAERETTSYWTLTRTLYTCSTSNPWDTSWVNILSCLFDSPRIPEYFLSSQIYSYTSGNCLLLTTFTAFWNIPMWNLKVKWYKLKGHVQCLVHFWTVRFPPRRIFYASKNSGVDQNSRSKRASETQKIHLFQKAS